VLFNHTKLATAVLLMVYAVIAGPVQLLHQHTEYNVNSTDCFYQQQYADTIDFAGNGLTDCKLCSHQYSSYHLSTAYIFVQVPLVLVTKTESRYETFLDGFSISFSNKGPPVFI
jgi:lipopolysaccharide export system protein LptC